MANWPKVVLAAERHRHLSAAAPSSAPGRDPDQLDAEAERVAATEAVRPEWTVEASPTVTVNPLGLNARVTLAASLAGTNGLTKLGAGPLVQPPFPPG